MHRSSFRPARTLAAALALVCGCAAGDPPADPEIPVLVETLVVDGSDSRFVLLEERGGPRILPIWIGTAEAISIAHQINETVPRRPNTHDLARRLIDSLDATVERVVVTSLRDDIYYGVLYLSVGERFIEIDVRPSDGIAVALRTGAPILVRASVFDSAGEPELEDPGREDPALEDVLEDAAGRPI